MVDPFLLFDTFESDNPKEYIGGFPDHPHRGFETVTYLLTGRMRHSDKIGNDGLIESGGVQWMTAGSGIVHSEMPEQEDGLLQGFQLWINLPSSAKMIPPAYQEFTASSIPNELLKYGGEIKVISGRTDKETLGPVINHYTDPLYLDVRLNPGEKFSQHIPNTHNGVIYTINGNVIFDQEDTILDARKLAVLGDGDCIEITGGGNGAHILLIAGLKLNEPIYRSGPFVMNTKEEVIQAYKDFQEGRL